MYPLNVFPLSLIMESDFSVLSFFKSFISYFSLNIPYFQREHPDKIHQAEDLTLKSASAIFGVDLLNCLDVSQSASAVMPTETIHLEVRHMYEDFNFMTDEGSWLHFEFESDALTIDDLKRFREYEAAISRTYKVPVTTYVLCSSDRKNSTKGNLLQNLICFRFCSLR